MTHSRLARCLVLSLAATMLAQCDESEPLAERDESTEDDDVAEPSDDTGDATGDGDASTETGAGGGGLGGDASSAGSGTVTSIDSGSDAASCPASAGDLAEAFAEAVCRKRGECCRDDYEVCITEVSDALDDIYVDLEDALQSGSAAVDCDSFDACASAIDSADCGEWPAQVGGLAEIPVDEPACRKLVTPLLAASDSCAWNYECQEGFCRSEDGLCYAFAEENAECADSLCDLPTMFCNAGGLCQRRLENGVACGEGPECQSGTCDSEGSGTCIAPGPDACEYVPAVPAACSLQAVPRGQGHRLPVPAGLALLGFWFAIGWRRSAGPPHAW